MPSLFFLHFHFFVKKLHRHFTVIAIHITFSCPSDCVNILLQIWLVATLGDFASFITITVSHYAKCYYIKLFFPSPPKKQIYVCRMPYLVWFWIYWFMKHGLSDLKIKIKSWKILFFEDNFGNLGDKWVQLFFFFGQNLMGKPFLGSDFNFTIPNLVLS